MTEPTPSCGLCGARECEVDELVQLGQMGHVCLSCLELVANEKLPGTVMLPTGFNHPQEMALRPVAMEIGELPESGKIIPLRPRRARTE